jgi:hypothetical protein
VAQLNSEVRHVFSVVDITGTPVSGLTGADFTFTLRRRSGASLIDSAEAVNAQSIGGGDYWVFYTPTAAATLYVLTIAANAATNVVNPYQWQDDISPASTSSVGPFLTTRAAIKVAFGFAQTEHDARIDALLPQVTDLFQKRCNRNFFQSSVTEYPPPLSQCMRMLLASKPPISTVTSLHISTAVPRVYDGTTLLIEGTDFIVSEDGQWIELVTPRYLNGVWSKVAKLVYTGGYSVIPGDLERAAQEVIGVKVLKGAGKMYHFLNEAVGDGQLQGLRWDDITPNALEVIDSYTLRSFP